MFTLFFAISLGVRPISPGRSARSARSVEPAQREKNWEFYFARGQICTKFKPMAGQSS